MKRRTLITGCAVILVCAGLAVVAWNEIRETAEEFDRPGPSRREA